MNRTVEMLAANYVETVQADDGTTRAVAAVRRAYKVESVAVALRAEYGCPWRRGS